MEKTAIFVDVQNIYYTTREAFQKHFDYHRFWTQATANRHIVAALAYAIDRNNAKQYQFQTILRNIGFSVKLKPFIQRHDGSAKGDWDVGITIDMMEIAPNVGRVILLSGDGDFSLLVDNIKQKHDIIVEVYGVKILTSKTLINSASIFHEIDNKLLM